MHNNFIIYSSVTVPTITSVLVLSLAVLIYFTSLLTLIGYLAVLVYYNLLKTVVLNYESVLLAKNLYN